MTSERQKAANRANARHSTGPKTPEGKAVVSRNALRHGLRARDVVLPEEDVDAFEDLLNRVRAELSPVGPIEEAFTASLSMLSDAMAGTESGLAEENLQARIRGNILMTLSNTVQNAIIGNDNSLLGGLIGAATLLVMNYVVVRFLYSHETIDRIVEGDADILVIDGQLQRERLKRELITVTELEEAAHKQGFGSLEEIDRAVLEPGGTLTFVGKKPSSDELQYREVLRRLDLIAQDVAALKR